MPAKRFSVEQIVAKLREGERHQAQGLTIPQSCKRLGISEQTFYRWRLKYGALKEDEAQRLKALEQENSRLKKIVAEQALDISLLKDLLQTGVWKRRDARVELGGRLLPLARRGPGDRGPGDTLDRVTPSRDLGDVALPDLILERGIRDRHPIAAVRDHNRRNEIVV